MVECSNGNFIDWPIEMIGNDQVYDQILWMAPNDMNVLILGETGVGKETVAKELHRCSQRKGRLGTVNCSAIQMSMAESELFGHIKGAFTGAIADRKGLFEESDGGTVFLDEFGDLPMDIQRKLLRAIEYKLIRRIGDKKEIAVDVRIIAATNSPIHKFVEEGEFGSDLIYRFGIQILIPPLRERKKDIPLQAHYFLDQYAKKTNMQARGITPQAMRCLLAYSWPNNSRGLESCIRKALLQSNGKIGVELIDAELHEWNEIGIQTTTPLDPIGPGKVNKEKPKSFKEIEDEYIKNVLKYTHGNKDQAAKIIEISRQTLLNKMDRYQIPRDFGKKLVLSR